jgi:lipoyl-dependent peroxiredoxin
LNLFDYEGEFLGAMKFVASQGGCKGPSDSTVAEALVAKAHQVCPYSNATRNGIDVKPTVE